MTEQLPQSAQTSTLAPEATRALPPKVPGTPDFAAGTAFEPFLFRRWKYNPVGSPSEDRAWLLPVALCVIALSFMLVFWNTKTGAIRNTNVGSRFATVEALVDHGGYAIDKTQYSRTIDKVKLNGHFLSSKPPLLPTTTAGVYWVFKKVTGYDIRKDESKVVTFCNVVMVGIPHALLLLYFFRFLTLLVRRREAILVGLIGVAFASLGVGYAVELNNHTVVSAIVLIAFYYAFRIRNEIEVKPRHWVIAGLLGGCVPGLDVPSTWIVACLGLYLLSYDPKKTLTLFLPALIPGIFTHFLMTYIGTGSFKPLYMRKEAYDYPGSYWNRPRAMDALREGKFVYAFNVLFGHHGVFTMTPPFVFSMVALYQTLKAQKERFLEAIFVSAAFFVLVLFYIFYTNNYGGSCVGMRWLIVTMPLLFLFFAVFLDGKKPLNNWMWALVVAAICVGHYNTEDALRSPWLTSKWHKWVNSVVKALNAPPPKPEVKVVAPKPVAPKPVAKPKPVVAKPEAAKPEAVAPAASAAEKPAAEKPAADKPAP